MVVKVDGKAKCHSHSIALSWYTYLTGLVCVCTTGAANVTYLYETAFLYKIYNASTTARFLPPQGRPRTLKRLTLADASAPLGVQEGPAESEL